MLRGTARRARHLVFEVTVDDDVLRGVESAHVLHLLRSFQRGPSSLQKKEPDSQPISG